MLPLDFFQRYKRKCRDFLPHLTQSQDQFLHHLIHAVVAVPEAITVGHWSYVRDNLMSQKKKQYKILLVKTIILMLNELTITNITKFKLFFYCVQTSLNQVEIPFLVESETI